MTQIQYTWSSKYVHTYYLTVSLADFLGSGYISSFNQLGIDITYSVEALGENYIVFKFINNNTPHNGAFELVYEYISTTGSDQILINVEYDDTTPTWEDAFGDFHIIQPYNPIVIDAGASKYILEYYGYQIDIANSDYYMQSNWATVNIRDGYVIEVVYEKNYGAARSNIFNFAAKCLEMDDYLESRAKQFYQVEGSISPQYTSNFNLEQNSVEVTSVATTAKIKTIETNIASVTPNVPSTYNWITATYNSSKKEISINVSLNTGARRNGVISINAVGTDGQTFSKIVRIKQGAAVTDGSFIVSDSGLSYDYNAGQKTVTIDTNRINLQTVSAQSNSGWIVATLNGNKTILTVDVSSNSQKVKRSGEVVLSGTSTGGGTAYYTIDVVQAASPEWVEHPIWQDVVETIVTEDGYIDYRIAEGDNIIFSGRTFAIDGICEIYLNEIIQNHLEEVIDFGDNELQDNKAYRVFVLQLFDGNVGEYVDYKLLKFYNDWSYEESDVNSGIISESYILSTVLDRRQYFIQSYIDKSNGSGMSINLSGARSTSTRPYNRNFRIENTIASIVFKAGILDNLYVSIGGDDPIQEYTIEDTCRPYCLYWLNKYGGFDYYLFNRATKQVDSIANYEIGRFVNNNYIDFETKQYLKEITESWQIKSDIVNDRQSEILAEIAHSPMVYLHILEDDKLIPVNVKDSQVEHKRFSNNGRKMVQYTFTIENSYKKKRK